MTPRAFTVDEANALIPKMEEIFVELRSLRASMASFTDRIQILDVLWGEDVRRPANPDHGEYLEHRADVRKLIARLEELVQEEIADRGIRFPTGAIEHGLLDFPTTFEGRWVYLCWQTGEPEIVAWHEVRGGFSGRKPLTADQAKVMGVADDPMDLDPSALDLWDL